ncbi:MAG TPA: chloride channel protein [Acidimicrobiales bacterium]|nr:chloride channel protein [Acidimicrobiales bacterium]
MAAVTGAACGLAVAAFERLASAGVDAVFRLPLAAQAVAPGLGVLLAVAIRQAGGRAGAETTDAYIHAFHDPRPRPDLGEVPVRLLASLATLGAGGPMGFEGPSAYMGAGIGAAVQRRLSRFFAPDESKLLLVAGAAAGVAAIFKAPVTGLVFALEVPFQEDVARSMLLPSAISAAASYVAFAAAAGTDPILPVAGRAPFNLVDLGGAAVVGLLAGVLARVFIAVVRRAKDMSGGRRPYLRAAAAGAVLAATVLAAHALSHEPLALGPGYHALRWALSPERSVPAVLALWVIRMVGTGATVGGGGVGGLFIPLVIQGALVGRAVGGVFDPANATLFPVVGMAAFLGAGYRVPLAAVVFVAEFTGRPGFVVPGLVAAVVAQLVMGRASISPYQVARRAGHLERRLALPLGAVVDAEARTVPPDATVEELFWQHLVANRSRAVAVVDGAAYLGMAGADDVAGVERAAWSTTAVAEIMRTDLPVAAPAWSVADAVAAMDEGGTDVLPVCDEAGFVGVVTAEGVVRLDDILRRATG